MDADFAALLQKVLDGTVTQIKEAPVEVEMTDEIAQYKQNLTAE